MDLSKCIVKLDHSVGTPDNLPNWRQIPGFPVYGVGQCTEEGLEKMNDKMTKDRTILFIMRQEPIVYVNGQPCAPRKREALHDNIMFNCKPDDLAALEVKFSSEVEAMIKDGKLEVHGDKELHENPMEREDVANETEVTSVKSFGALMKDMTAKNEGTSTARVPFVEERPLPEECFDQITCQLANESPSTCQCVFVSQMGKGRSTLGTVIACIVKASQMIIKLDKMVDEGMAARDWADGIIKTKFEDPVPSEDLKDPFLRGEFDVIKELLEKHPEMVAGKILADKMIDICGVPPEGTGLQNLRKAIIQTKYKYDAATEDKQIVWKRMIINFIERYFYLICFATYARQNAKDAFKKTFKQFMDEHSDLRPMIENGKDKLEWYRKVDEGAVSSLKNMIDVPDYKTKLGAIVGSLYKLAFKTYADIPRGPVKDNLMRKLACKTLMEILPPEVHDRVQKELAEKKLSTDFDTVMGLVVA
eukprot:TRINITY_DN15970_c0_g1_i1.p1 TRINITY_DN15970_c0_g1~~TRINITY_DN15970_c0_g1_i1.p1  ORF type:complete len:475 (+),score=182.69 TRINITY_DN15970_c0_g1_i1:73-1497(+)